MLTDTIYRGYLKGTARYAEHPGIQVLAQGSQTSGKNCAHPTLFKTTSDVLTNHPELSEEVFGPASVIVGVNAKSEMLTLARNLTGHLTATVHGTEKDLADYQDLIDILEQKVGRIVINGFPTGVEVCHAMVHGGPYPATTDGRSTSVGTASIFRFTRAVCYQNMPQAQLPAALKDDNPDGIMRLLNGERTKGIIV
jgi:NADP-dependent aldehyde dehydrogenase